MIPPFCIEVHLTPLFVRLIEGCMLNCQGCHEDVELAAADVSINDGHGSRINVIEAPGCDPAIAGVVGSSEGNLDGSESAECLSVF